MSIEERLDCIEERLASQFAILMEIKSSVVAEKEDKSKCLVSARESTSKEQPSNHGRKGKLPRSREGCFKNKEANTS